MFGRLTDLIENARELSLPSVFLFVVNNKKPISEGLNFKQLVIWLNTEEQLFEKGIDAKGRYLEDIGGEYAESTVKKKRRDGLPSDRVTLFQTGDFYESFEVTTEKDQFVISAFTLKGTGEGLQDLRTRWGKDIVGLNKESQKLLVSAIIPEIRQYILNLLLK